MERTWYVPDLLVSELGWNLWGVAIDGCSRAISLKIQLLSEALVVATKHHLVAYGPGVLSPLCN